MASYPVKFSRKYTYTELLTEANAGRLNADTIYFAKGETKGIFVGNEQKAVGYVIESQTPGYINVDGKDVYIHGLSEQFDELVKSYTAADAAIISSYKDADAALEEEFTAGYTELKAADAAIITSYEIADANILAHTVNSKAISTNPVLNGADIRLDGYELPETASAIDEGDTVNVALGKLEKKLDEVGGDALSYITAVNGVTVSTKTDHWQKVEGVVDSTTEKDHNDNAFLTVGAGGFKVDGIKDEIEYQISNLDVTSNVSVEVAGIKVEVDEIDGKVQTPVVTVDSADDVDDFTSTNTNVASAKGVVAYVGDVIGNLDATNNVSDAVLGVTVQVDEIDGIVSQPVVAIDGANEATDFVLTGDDKVATAHGVAAYVAGVIDGLDKGDTAASGQYVSAVSEENGIITVSRENIPVVGVVTDDKILSLDSDRKVTSTMSFEYDDNTRMIYLYGSAKDAAHKIGEVDCEKFIKDGILYDQIVMNATGTSMTVTFPKTGEGVHSHEYTGLTAGHTYLFLEFWDGLGTEASNYSFDQADLHSLIDVYTAGDGLQLGTDTADHEFSIKIDTDTTKDDDGNSILSASANGLKADLSDWEVRHIDTTATNGVNLALTGSTVDVTVTPGAVADGDTSVVTGGTVWSYLNTADTATDNKAGITVNLGGVIGNHTIDVAVATGTIEAGNANVITGGIAYNYIQSALEIAGEKTFDDEATFKDDITVEGGAYTGYMDAKNGAHVGGNLDVDGGTYTGYMDAEEGAHVGGDLDVDENITAGGDVAGNTSHFTASYISSTTIDANGVDTTTLTVDGDGWENIKNGKNETLGSYMNDIIKTITAYGEHEISSESVDNNGIKVTLGGTTYTPTIEVVAYEGVIAEGNAYFVTGDAVNAAYTYTMGVIEENERVVAGALNDLEDRKQNKVSLTTSGEGALVSDVTFDASSYTFTVTKTNISTTTGSVGSNDDNWKNVLSYVYVGSDDVLSGKVNDIPAAVGAATLAESNDGYMTATQAYNLEICISALTWED